MKPLDGWLIVMNSRASAVVPSTLCITDSIKDGRRGNLEDSSKGCRTLTVALNVELNVEAVIFLTAL